MANPNKARVVQCPVGIKYKDWTGKGKKHQGHAPSHAYGRSFGTQKCRNGHETRTALGQRPITECPTCKVAIDHRGYV